MKKGKERKQEIERLLLKERKVALKRRDLEEQEIVERSLPKSKKSLGKCYVYKNSYGGNRESWPLYVKVVAIDEKTMEFRTVEFQKTTMDIVEMRYGHKYNFNGENCFERRGGYSEIPQKGYDAAKKKLLKFVQDLLTQ